MGYREALKVLFSSGSGRAGVAFLLALVTLSLYVVATYPLDFGLKRWNNPTVWADYPKNAPPAWTNWFGSTKRSPHTVLRAAKPSAVIPIGGGESRFYVFTINHTADEPPTFISFSIGEVVYFEAPPVVTLAVQRPDGRELGLFRHIVRSPRLGEVAPFARYTEAPFRAYLSADETALLAASDFLRREFGSPFSASQLQGKLEQTIFGLPSTTDLGGFVLLPGVYTITVRADVRDTKDSIQNIQVVLGGSVFGVVGTDSLGRDLATGLLFGFPVALLIGLTTAVLATALGTFMGLLSGYSGGGTDLLIQRSCDVLNNIPLLPILIFLVFILGQKLWLVIAILIVFGWPGLTIITRSMVLQIRSGQLVEATQALGASRWRIMFRHILFQIAPFILAQMIFFTPGAILAEAGLSFLGLGDPSIPTWGQILESGFRTGAVYLGYWWWILPPGLLIVITALTFVLITLALEPVVNPRLRTT